MDRGKHLVSLALNKQLQTKIRNVKNQSRKRKLLDDVDYQPISDSEDSNSTQSDEYKENCSTSMKINIISNIIIPASQCSFLATNIGDVPVTNVTNVPTTNVSNEYDGLKIVDELLNELLINVEQETQRTLLTKTGQPRKRRKYDKTIQERKVIQKQKVIHQHQLKDPCKRSCLKKCTDKILYEHRAFINNSFWNMTRQDQRNFILNSMTKTTTKRKTTNSLESRRLHTFTYTFKDVNGCRQEVCKVFFLTTLGFVKTNDKVIRNVISNTEKYSIVSKKDARGASNRKFDRELIITHINSFNPQVAHYRREHSPLRKYLPCDLSIKFMYDDFRSKYPDINFSYYLYRQVVSSLNISFVKLGHEECWACELFQVHQKATGHVKECLVADCKECETWGKHHKLYKAARAEYQNDCARNEVVITADLQKVIMLPRCDTFKEVIFVPRIIAYNESFVPAGKRPKVPFFAVVWHEATAGRCKSDIISSFYSYFLQMRDITHLILWMDNCSSQNKNWTLYSFFVYLLNCDEVALELLELKYFEPGHTFMAADSFHHRVEHSLKMKGKVYDFADYVNAVATSCKSVQVIELRDSSFFFDWKDHCSKHKLTKTSPKPYLSDMVHVIFRRGEKTLTYATSFGENAINLNFLTHKAFKTGITKPQCRNMCRGVTEIRKQTIINKLCQIMPANRLQFWKSLPVSAKETEEESD